MLTKTKMLSLFERLNALLQKENIVGEVGVIGGAVMCLAYNARASTKDIDAIFEPATLIRRLAESIAQEDKCDPDWLNDAAKAFMVPGFQQVPLLKLSHLSVWMPDPRYMLAMKCISARWDTSDRDDVKTLIGILKLQTPEEVFAIIEFFYRGKEIPAKTQFFIEELMALSHH